MQSLHASIQQDFYDKASGYYRVVVDSTKHEKKDGYSRKYTYVWSLCALYQGSNEIEKLDPNIKLMGPVLKIRLSLALVIVLTATTLLMPRWYILAALDFRLSIVSLMLSL